MLVTDPIRWPLEAIWQAVEPHLPGFTCEVLPIIDSTNSELMRRMKAGQSVPTLLVAERQSAGRGRLGRHWHSQRGDSLTFSLGLPLAPADWSGLSLAVGVSLAESLDVANLDGQRIALKWPNDLWLSQSNHAGRKEGKLAGVLVETANIGGQRCVVVGVGINVGISVGIDVVTDVSTNLVTNAGIAVDTNALNRDFKPESALRVRSAGLQELFSDADVAGVLGLVAPPLAQSLLAFERLGFAPFQARFAQRDVLAGREVQLSDGTRGTARGITKTGSLLVHTLAGMKEITSSEVSVRPC